MFVAVIGNFVNFWFLDLFALSTQHRGNISTALGAIMQQLELTARTWTKLSL